MRHWLTALKFAGAAAVWIIAVQWAAMLSASSQEAYRAPRTTDGKPNLSGIWQALNTANWDLQTHPARPGLVAAGARGAMPAGIAAGAGGGNAQPPAPAG